MNNTQTKSKPAKNEVKNRWALTELEPELISESEFEAGRELQKKYEDFLNQKHSLASETFTERVKEAEQTYFHSPTRDNLRSLMDATIDLNVLSVAFRPRESVQIAFRDFYDQEIVPWAKTIVARALGVAEKALQKITSEENERHLALAGKPIGRSEIVEAARQPVSLCRSLIAGLEDKSNLNHRQPRDFVELLGFKW